ncbi:RDD family protein [Xenophilus arseniciresistens]|uniref:RDD family protein n=1 Tax=Xenophilus arseniciresistens TaxID=1283306 RepID=A0AAE3SYL2_9BURK|nr:RDD family protein [Xenophilus arseniciresistens]MDA7416222.1 RDD family protein [Xenophilus arseniciresistens]
MSSPPPSSQAVGPGPSVAPFAPPGIPRRMAAWLYEGMLLFAVVFVAGWLFSALSQMRHALDDRRVLLQAFLFVVFGIYFVWFWSRGQTLAMKTWGLRLVGRDGRPVSQWRALLRYVLAWLWFLPPLVLAWALPFQVSGAEVSVLLFGWVAIWAVLARFHPERQFWHDAWAGTRLISTRPR